MRVDRARAGAVGRDAIVKEISRRREHENWEFD
jgi:hypothetical protein